MIHLNFQKLNKVLRCRKKNIGNNKKNSWSHMECLIISSNRERILEATENNVVWNRELVLRKMWRNVQVEIYTWPHVESGLVDGKAGSGNQLVIILINLCKRIVEYELGGMGVGKTLIDLQRIGKCGETWPTTSLTDTTEEE